MSDHVHDWQHSPDLSDVRTMRYVCNCGSKAWRKRPLIICGKLEPGGEITEYKPDARVASKRPVLKEPGNIANPHAGTNGAGHFLPGGTGGRRR